MSLSLRQSSVIVARTRSSFVSVTLRQSSVIVARIGNSFIEYELYGCGE